MIVNKKIHTHPLTKHLKALKVLILETYKIDHDYAHHNSAQYLLGITFNILIHIKWYSSGMLHN